MTRSRLNPKIMMALKEKTKGSITEQAIRNGLTRIRREHTFLTLNAAAEVFAKKRGFSVSRYLDDRDRDSLKSVRIEKIKILASRSGQKKRIIEIAEFQTDDKLLKAHLDEINKAYTYGCYTAAFVLCRKTLENLMIHRIFKVKYPENSKEHRERYFDFARDRFLDFDKLLNNLRKCAKDFGPENRLVERIADKSGEFKEDANDMAHSLYHIASKKEIDDRNFQYILDLIQELENAQPSVPPP